MRSSLFGPASIWLNLICFAQCGQMMVENMAGNGFARIVNPIRGHWDN